jgi:glucose/mannose transport system permease protein
LPPTLLIGLFVYGAILWNVILSLTDFQGLGEPDYSNLDFENYVVAFDGGTPSWSNLSVDPIWNATQNTVALMLGFAIICLALGLLMAILVDQEIRFENTFRTIYLLPMSLSFVVTAKFWLYMYDAENGLVGIESFSLGPIAIGSIGVPVKLAAVIFALIWQFSGYAMIVYLAGLRAIPSSHFEAARVDGASTIRMYWRVIIPQLRTATVSALVVLVVFALKAFDFLFAMYGGYNPGPSADILATQMVREAYGNQNWAYGSAIAVILFVMALTIVAPYIYSQYQRGQL